MKNILKISMMYLLFQMIVLPSISQVVYEIGGNRYTCYTSEENRTIARIFLTEEFLDNKIDILRNEILHLNSYNKELSLELGNCRDLLNKYSNTNDELSILYNEVYSDYNNVKLERDRYKKFTYIAGGTSVSLIVLIIGIVILN